MSIELDVPNVNVDILNDLQPVNVDILNDLQNVNVDVLNDLQNTRVLIRRPEHIVNQNGLPIPDVAISALSAISASYALSASLANTASFANIAQLALAVSASAIDYENVLNRPTLVSSSGQVELQDVSGSTFAASNFTFPQNLHIDGTLTANTVIVSSSQIYSSGSTKFGDSVEDTHQFTGSLGVDGPSILQNISVSTLQVRANENTSTLISSSITTGVFNATEIINPPFHVTEYSGILVEYVAQRAGGVRTGMLYGSWSGSSITHTDVSNTDVGDTSDLSFNFIRVGDNILLRAYSEGSGSGAWTIQCLFKMFPNLL